MSKFLMQTTTKVDYTGKTFQDPKTRSKDCSSSSDGTVQLNKENKRNQNSLAEQQNYQQTINQIVPKALCDSVKFFPSQAGVE